MKKKLLLIIILILLVGIGYDVYHRYQHNQELKENKTENSLKNGVDSTDDEKTAAPDFKLKDLNGKEVSLSKLKGKKIFLNFWATWCPPCKAEMPDIEKLYEENKDNQDVVILTVNMGEPKETVSQFIKQNNYKFPVVIDDGGKIAELYNVIAVPTSFFIDKEGNINSMDSGALSLDEMKLELGKLK